jgi:hypothetical protein
MRVFVDMITYTVSPDYKYTGPKKVAEPMKPRKKENKKEKKKKDKKRDNQTPSAESETNSGN